MKRNYFHVVTGFLLVAAFLSSFGIKAQNIHGSFPLLAGQQIRLEGYYGFESYLIGSADVSEEGKFMLNFSEADYGIGQLVLVDSRPFIVILSGEDIELKGESFDHTESIGILKGRENMLFEQYALEHPRREQALSAWDYLERIYSRDSLFAVHNDPVTAIVREKRRIKEEDRAFLESLDRHSYVSWLLPVRKLLSSVPTIAQYRTEEIPGAIAAFRNIDYTDPRLYKSGLLQNLIESHFWLIENSGRSLDSVFIEMNISIDHLIDNIVTDEKKFNEITGFLFNLLERRSLFGSSEYLALKILNEISCTIDNDLAAQLESYRAMKPGNSAPDFAFSGDIIAPGYALSDIPGKLSDLNSEYTLVVFGAGWCPGCPEELSQIAGLYRKWKAHGIEVVFVSLDEERQIFKNFAAVFPFISICDYQKWESPVIKAWHIFATPAFYLLDTNLQILLRPNSARHMDAWVDWLSGGG
jgi:thiol-disulfide isomerase/thioredoxin